MQICANDENKRVIFAAEAVKHQDYFCVECNEPVRLRSGIYRQAHFYHIRPNGACRLHSKGLPHLMLQYYLRDLLPQGEVDLECRFDAIGRIADVAWHPRRLIYEIQCSPIRPQEIRERNRDYASLGYQVVWILHDSKYNRYRLSAAEDALIGHTHYFSNMDAEGEGKIYDQFSIVHKGKRTNRFLAVDIDPAAPELYPREIKGKNPRSSLPFPLLKRLETWKSALAGDTLHRFIRHIQETGTGNAPCPALEEQFDWLVRRYNRPAMGKIPEWIGKACSKYFAVPYRSVLQLILERACR